MLTLIQAAAHALRNGLLIGLPTETVYGLGADASNEFAVRNIFAVKGRPSTHPLIVHVASLEAAQDWASEFSPAALTLAKRFWPGPLTLIVNRSHKATDAITGGQNTVGLRVPAHPMALELLREFGGGIAAPSANKFGRISPTTAQHVISELGEAVSLVLDGGACEVGLESTIVDVSTDTPRLLRPGGLALQPIEAALQHRLLPGENDTGIRAPGMLASHYAPRAGLKLVTPASIQSEIENATKHGLRVATIAEQKIVTYNTVRCFEAPKSDAEFARSLFSLMRQADEVADLILVIPPEEEGLGLAIRDRLMRASTPRK